MSAEQSTPDRSQLVMIKAEPFNAETPLDALCAPLTPTAAHFVRSNFALPAHDGRLTVTGAVDHPLTLTLNDLRAMPSETLTVTLECAGNGRVGLMPLPTGEPWTGQAFGTATWTGVPLHLILERAAPQPDGVEVAFTGADHGHYKGGPDIPFARAQALGRTLDPAAQILVAYAMNGEPLNADHGAPFRLLVPGWYGMASVKWLARIEVLTAPYVGQFQTKSYVFEWPDRPWAPVSTIRPRAFILDPAPDTTLPGRGVTVRGKAWSGGGPVTRVEVSIEGAGPWLDAQLEPPGEPYGWQEWSITCEFPYAGRHVIRARATDSTGATQPDSPEWNRLGYGNNAAQIVVVNAR